MRVLAALVLLLASLYSFSAYACGKTSAPEDVVQAQVDAYNAHDVEAFARCYAEDVTIYDLSGDTPPVRGIPELKKDYAWLAKAPPEFRVEIVRRITSGRIVIDLERIHGLPKEKGTPEATAVFEVRDGKIKNVWFPPSN
jgi:putative hydrolase of HD superfamily